MAASDSRTHALDATVEAAHIAKARGGDTGALRNLLHHYAAGIYRVAHALTQDVRAAVMLCSATCDRARDEIGQIPQDEPFFLWILRIEGELARVSRDADSAGVGHVPAPRMDPNAVSDPLRRGFTQLEPNEQLVLALRVVEELSYPRIAGVFQATSTSALSLVASARSHLLEQLERRERAV